MRRFTPLARRRSVLVRLFVGASLAAGLAIATIQAQIPGRNVNMVSGTKLPEGDPFLQRQNEPSIAASTRNPLHLLGGSNDYRTVDVPGMCLEYGPDPTDPSKQICIKNEEVTGDAWLGLFKSTDGGQRWASGLLPGYPQDGSPAGLASPLHAKPNVPGSGYQAGADAVVRAGTHGMIYYSGLAFDRADNGKSGVFLARFIDNNNQEAGDPVAYLGTTMVAQSTGAKFLDKPWMAVDVPRSNAAMCTVTSDNILPTQQNGRRRKHGYDRDERHDNDDDHRGRHDRDDDRRGRRGRPSPKPPKPPKPMVQKIPAGAIYVTYSSITGDAATLRSEILISRSMDCGNTWSSPIKVSPASDYVNQGSSLTIDPKTGAVYISWRRFDPDLTDTNDLDAIMVARLPFGAAKVDTPSRAHRFPRPTRKVGRQLHRLFEHRENRFKEKGAKPTEAVENLDQFDLGTTGYNFRTNAYPTMAADGTGRIYVAWTQRGFAANSGVADGARIVIATTRDGKTFTTPTPVDNHATPGRGHQLMPSMAFAGGKLMLVFYDLRDSKAGTHNRISSDFNTETGLRQTIDIRSAMATPSDNPVFPPSVKVSDYLMGFNPETEEVEELQVNPPNLPMFKQGTVPFIGDYIDVAAAPAFIPGKNGKWDFNTANTGEIPTFHAAWTDNRDVRPPKNGEWWNYTPAKMSPDQMAGASIYDPSQNTLQCVDGVGNPGSRNQNIYSARITGGLLAGSPGNAKPLSTELQRGFVVFAQNTTKLTKSYRMTIMAQPVGGRASFDQFPLPPYTAASPAPETAIEMIVPPLSTASRTVYVTSSDANAQLTVDVSELTDLRLLASPALYPTAPEKTGGLEARVVLNPDIENPDIENPDIENPDIENPDIENVEVYNPDIENPDIENPDIENPDIENPDIENPDIENPDIENPDIENVRVANPDIENPDIENPDIENPDIENPDIENPDIENPDIENVRVANPDIENPDIENPDIENPDIENPDIENPDIENPDIENGAIADITWKVSNTGNTTASFNVNLFLAQQTLPTGVKTQLVLLKTYRTPVTQANKCQLGFQTRNILLANIRNPILVPPGGGTANANDPAETNATLWLAPGEEGRIVLRVIDEDTSNNVPVTKPNGDVEYIDPSMLPSEDVSPVVQQQAVNSDDAETGVTEPPVVPPPAPPATDDTVWTSPGTPVRINVLGNDAALFGSTKILSTHPAGLAQNMGASANELVYMPTTGLVYAGTGRSVGVIDPVSNHLVGRIPTDPTDGQLTYGLASPKTGMLFFRAGGSGQPGASLYAFDGRPTSPLFNREFPAGPGMMPLIDALGDLHTFTLDTTGTVLYYVAGTSTQQTVSAINADPANPLTAGQILWGPIALPANGKAWHIAQNPATGKLYIASLNNGPGLPAGGGVYMINPAAPAAPVKITGADQATSIAINPATNLVFAAGAFSGNYRLNTIDGATDALLGQVAVLGGGVRQNNTEDRLVVHHATGRVYLRGPNQVFVFNGLKGSPTFNQLVVTHGAGPDFNNSDLVVDQATGVVAMAGNFVHSIAVIDAVTDGIAWLPALGRAAGEIAVDPATHRLFVADFLSAVHAYSATSFATVTKTATLEVSPETAQVLVNAATSRAYVAASGAGSTINVISGAGVVGPVANLSPQKGRWGFGGQLGTNFYFTNSGSDDAGGQSRPGALVRINGATDTAVQLVPTIGQPFGFGVNAAASQLIVAGLNGLSPTGANEAGKIRIHDALDPSIGVDADLTGVPVNNPTSIAFGRHVVTNPNTGNTYVMITGGSPRSVLYLPQTGLPTAPVAVALDLTTLPGLSLTVDDRVEVIRVSAATNLIYLGLANAVSNTYHVVALDGATHALVGSFAGGGHSRLHTPSWVAVNAAGDRVYVVDYNADKVTMHGASLGAPIATTNLPEGPSSSAFNNSLNRLYVGSLDGKSVTAIDGTSLAVLSTVKLPLLAPFLYPSESDNRLYTSGGTSPDESGFMVLSDVAGNLGAPVTVTSATAGGGATATIDTDSSITYTPAPGFTGVDTFTYTAQTAAGDSTATVTVNVIPVAASPVAFSDAYATATGVTLNVGGRGVLANDAVSNTATVTEVGTLSGLTLNANGSFTYVPSAAGTFQFQYLAIDGPNSNLATATINVITPVNPLIVVNTNDSGAGSLRSAITYANSTPVADTITFAIPAGPMGPPFVIAPVSQLPALNGGTTIDGLSQTGASAGALKVVVSGSNLPLDANGLVLSGNNNIISGLVINHFPASPAFAGGSAVVMSGNSNRVEASFIGTAPDGSSPALVNSYSGIRVSGNGNRVGGLSMGMRNVIAGNAQGVWVTGGSANTIAFNNIGTNFLGNAVVPAIAGSPAHGNQFGVLVDSGSGAVIGLPGPLSNVISGNLTGVQLRGGSNTQVAANYIGLDAAGTTAIPNGDGISAYNTVANTTIGGASVSNENVIAGNSAWGINLQGAGVTNTSVFNNRIGLNILNAGRANVDGGIRNIDAVGTTIGAPSRTNVISGNNGPNGFGILIGGLTAGATIQSNRIGTDPSGTFAIPNGPAGGDNAAVFVDSGASGVLIGGSISAGEGNVISGNSAYGVKLWGSNNQVKGNLIGTNLPGNAAVPNGKYGVHVEIGANNVIGSSGGFHNVISGNTLAGVVVSGAGPFGGAYGTLIDSNAIGVGSNFSTVIPNGGAGVDLREATSTEVAANTIRGNTGAGVVVQQGTTGNLIATSTIYGNGGLGIDLDGNGVTPNDGGDGDTGSNNGQNYPLLSNAVNNAGSASVTYDTTSFAPGSYVLRFYANTACDPSGFGEGEQFVGSVTVGAGATGTAGLSGLATVGKHITATATRGTETSEFSACTPVTAAPAVITSVSPNPSAPGFGQHLSIRGTNLPGVNPSDVILNITGGGDNIAQNIWHISPTLVVARFVVGTPVTTGTIRVKSPDGSIVSNSFPITLQATPGAPTITAVATTSGGSGFISSTTMGDTIYVSAEGIDTNYYTVVFTPTSPAGAPIEVAAGPTSAGPGGSFSAQVKVPTFMSLTSMTVNVQVKTTVNGNTSPLSAAHSMTVNSSLSVVGPVGGTGGATPYGPVYCPAGFPANGVRVATNDTAINDIWGNVNYDVTAAEWMCNNGGATQKFGGGPTPNTALQCASGELMVGIFGAVDGAVLGAIGPRCQDSTGGSINQPWGARPAGGTPFTLDCPANNVVVGASGRSGSVLDSVSVVCAPRP